MKACGGAALPVVVNMAAAVRYGSLGRKVQELRESSQRRTRRKRVVGTDDPRAGAQQFLQGRPAKWKHRGPSLGPEGTVSAGARLGCCWRSVAAGLHEARVDLCQAAGAQCG